jgi:hypothetical protein
MFDKATIRRALPGHLFTSMQIPVCLGFRASPARAMEFHVYEQPERGKSLTFSRMAVSMGT